MITRNDFTLSEWETLTEAPFLIGLTVSDIDTTGSSAVKEFDAILKTLDKAREKYKENGLICEVLEEAGGMSQLEEGIKPEKDIIQHFREMAKMLDDKGFPLETYEFKQFLYWISWNVANAYGEGFLGLGDKVSDKESYILEKIRDALSV